MRKMMVFGHALGLWFLSSSSLVGPMAIAHERSEAAAVQPAMLDETWAVEWWEPRHKQKLHEAAEGDFDLVMIGDSITHGWEEDGASVWEEYYGHRKGLNLGFSGDRTENVLWRLQHGAVDGLAPQLVVLMIGTNNTGHRQDDPQDTALGVETIIAELQTRLPQAQILLLGIFPRGATADDELRQINTDINRKLEKLAGERVTFLDVGPHFLDEKQNLPETLMPDLLHPSEKGYRVWAKAMEPTLQSLLAD